jgi:hypothetical protein
LEYDAMRTAFRNTVITASSVLAFSALLIVGCSSDEDKASPATFPSGPFCPATLAAALDPATKCVGDNFECPIGYPCGAFESQAYCTCAGGKFTCKTSRGDEIASADEAPCAAPGVGADKECPQTQNGTDGQTCKTAGLQCFYQGFTCPESPDVPKQDVCQCVSQPLPDGGPTLQFRCEIEYCNPKSDASFSTPDAGTGGG